MALAGRHGNREGSPDSQPVHITGEAGLESHSSPERGMAGHPVLAVCTEQLWASGSSPGLREAVREEGIHVGRGHGCCRSLGAPFIGLGAQGTAEAWWSRQLGHQGRGVKEPGGTLGG